MNFPWMRIFFWICPVIGLALGVLIGWFMQQQAPAGTWSGGLLLLSAVAGLLFGLAILFFHIALSRKSVKPQVKGWRGLVQELFEGFPSLSAELKGEDIPSDWRATFLCRLYLESVRLRVFEETQEAVRSAVDQGKLDEEVVSLALQTFIATSPSMSPEEYRMLIRSIKQNPAGDMDQIRGIARAARKDFVIKAILTAIGRERMASFLTTPQSMRRTERLKSE